MSYSHHLPQLVAEISEQTRGGPGAEPETAAMFGGLLLAYEIEAGLPTTEPRPITQLLDDTAHYQIGGKEKLPPAATSVLRTALVNYFRRFYLEQQHRHFSDEGLVNPADWSEPITNLGQDLANLRSFAAETLDANVMIRHAVTPAKERAASVDLVAQLTAERFPAGARGLDIGTSLMVGPIQLVYKHQFPMKLRQVTYQAPGQENSRRLTAKANAILDRPSMFDSFVANDDFPVYNNRTNGDSEHLEYDRAAVDFALSGLRPSERNNPIYDRDIRSMLDKKQHGSWNYDDEEKVKFWWGNLLESDGYEEFTGKFPGSFDVIVLSYVTQELTPESQLRMNDIVNHLASPNGLIIYVHQARLKGRPQQSPVPFEAVEHYTTYATIPYRSQMHVIDKLYPGANSGLQHALTFRDNRCQVAQVGEAKLWVNGKLEPVADLIQHSADSDRSF